VGQTCLLADVLPTWPNAAEVLGIMGLLAGLVKSPNLSAQTLWAGLSMVLACFLLLQNFRRVFRELADQQGAARPLTGPWNPSFEQSDRRRAFRRAGNPVRVLVVGLDGNRRLESRVLDRSTAGLRLESPVSVSVDTVLLVKACTAPADSLWVPVDVRWCRTGRRRNLLGCRFIDPVPVSTMAHFG
jgi:PilZ domain